MANPNFHQDTLPKVPRWGKGILTLDEYAELTRLMAEEVERQALPAAFDLRRGVVTISGGAAGRISLRGLARLCRSRGRAAWPGLIREFFSTVRRVHDDPTGLLDSFARYEEARGRVKIRLHSEAYLAHPDAHELVLRKVADGIAGLLVADLGFANLAVPADVAQGWGVPPDEVWAQAVANVRAEGRLEECQGVEVGVPIDMLASASHYAASHLLFFQDYLPADAGFGALVGVPHRHVLVRHVIRDRDVFAAAHVMAHVIDDWYREGPGEITRELYWWRAGELTSLALRRHRGVITFDVSQRFVTEVLDKLLAGN